MGMSERRGSVFWKAPESRVGITHSQWGLQLQLVQMGDGRVVGEALTAPMGWELSKRRQESLESWSRGVAGHRQHMNRSLARGLGDQ